MHAYDYLRRHAGRTCIRERGFTMVEVLVTILILTIGLLGLAGMLSKAFSAESESYQRAQAAIFLNDMVDRISANRLTAKCFAQSYGSGVTSITACINLPGVSGAAMDSATLGIQDIQTQLLGSAETTSSGATKVGGALNARACILQDTGDATIYDLAVAWQGLAPTVAPTAPSGANTSLVNVVACGNGSYGSNDALRRLVWTSVRIANLT